MIRRFDNGVVSPVAAFHVASRMSLSPQRRGKCAYVELDEIAHRRISMMIPATKSNRPREYLKSWKLSRMQKRIELAFLMELRENEVLHTHDGRIRKNAG